jgi:hypothetical protein
VTVGAHSLAKRDSRNPVIGVRKENHFIKVTEAKLNETYKNSINWTVEYLFRYVYTLPADGALSVHVESSTATADHPVLIVVREQTAVSSWQLPFILESSSGP